MTRSKCGLLLLLAAGVGACGGDPTESFKEEGQKIVTDPAVVRVNQGASVFVIAQLQDNQGNQLATSFEATPLGGGFTVTRDTSYLETTNGSALKTRERFQVTGVTPSSAAFEISGGGLKDTIPVGVLPIDVAASFSNAAPALNESITITLPAGYKFGADAGVESNLGPGLVESVAPDGSSIVAVIPPGSTGAVTLSGITADFLPGIPLSVPSIDVVAASAVGFPGTDAPTTAPALPVPAAGETVTLFDVGTMTGADITGDGGIGAQYYKLTVVDSAAYTFTTTWQGAADLDAILCFDTACNAGAAVGASANNPESATVDLSPGTYYFSVVLFAGGAPQFFQMAITQELPQTPGD
ncbi:MAG TPA: hypothetical protein VF046_09125 [Gemmatimonadales bacterium]